MISVSGPWGVQPFQGESAEQEGMKVFVARELATPLEMPPSDVPRAIGTPRFIFRPKGEDASAPA